MLVWGSGVMLVLLIQLVFARASGRTLDWVAALTLALVIPSVGIAGVVVTMREALRRPGKD